MVNIKPNIYINLNIYGWGVGLPKTIDDEEKSIAYLTE